VGVNIAIVCAFVFAVVLPFRELLADQEIKLAERRETLARLRAVADRQADVEAFALAVKADASRGDFLEGPNEGVVSAALQARLKQAAEAAGASLRSVRALSAKAAGEARFTGGRLEFAGPIKALHEALRDIESGTPNLFITSAILRAAPNRAGATEDVVIEAQVDVFGPTRIAEAK
jgi:general secretion pathway protein M